MVSPKVNIWGRNTVVSSEREEKREKRREEGREEGGEGGGNGRKVQVPSLWPSETFPPVQ